MPLSWLLNPSERDLKENVVYQDTAVEVLDGLKEQFSQSMVHVFLIIALAH